MLDFCYSLEAGNLLSEYVIFIYKENGENSSKSSPFHISRFPISAMYTQVYARKNPGQNLGFLSLSLSPKCYRSLAIKYNGFAHLRACVRLPCSQAKQKPGILIKRIFQPDKSTKNTRTHVHPPPFALITSITRKKERAGSISPSLGHSISPCAKAFSLLLACV